MSLGDRKAELGEFKRFAVLSNLSKAHDLALPLVTGLSKAQFVKVQIVLENGQGHCLPRRRPTRCSHLLGHFIRYACRIAAVPPKLLVFRHP